MATKKTYTGDFETQRGQTKSFGSRPTLQVEMRFPTPTHIIGHVYYELWSNGTRVYNGASDDFRQRLHGLIQERKIHGVDKIVVINYDNPKDRDDKEVKEQLKSLPPRNRRVQRNTWNQGVRYG